MFAFLAGARNRVHVNFVARLIAPLVLAITLTGCVSFFDAELNNRGGYLDQKLDSRWMIADTKQMRVLRAYILIGSLARLSRENYYASERKLLGDHVNKAILVANDAFTCAYANPGECVYFDERMAELEVAILRLTVAVFTKQENEQLFKGLSEAFGNALPFYKALDSAASVFDFATYTADFMSATSKLVSSILRFAEAGYLSGRRIGSLYRDSIELEMVTVLTNLELLCIYEGGKIAPSFSSAKAKDAEEKSAEATIRNFYGTPDYQSKFARPNANISACGAYGEGYDLWKRGSGELTQWKIFLTEKASEFSQWIIPDENAFIQASDLIWRACEQIADKEVDRSRCLGRREEQLTKKPQCGCMSEGEKISCPYLSPQVAATKESVDKAKGKTTTATSGGTAAQAAGRLAMPYEDKCGLILFAKTWDRRQDRYSQSMARIYWLSGENRRLTEPEPVAKPRI